MKQLIYLCLSLVFLCLFALQPEVQAQSSKDKKTHAKYKASQKKAPLSAKDAEKHKEAKVKADKIASNNKAAQVERCSTDSYMEKLLGDPQRAAAYQARMDEIKSKVDMSRVSIPCDASNTFIVPVAIHFDAAYSCANTQCLIDATNAQIQSLNDDFAALNADLTLFTNDIVGCGAPDVASDGACITFCIATQNHPAVSGIPNGQPAITIGEYAGGTGANSTATNGEWPGVLNMFVVDGLGYGVSDGIGGDWSGTGVSTDGAFWGGPNFSACSSGGSLDDDANWDLGRTLTHEVGHYLGLWHTFQNPCANEPGTPFPVTDTPGQAGSSSGCPGTGSCPALDTGCGTGDFLQFNFMDYYDDACLVMFSEEQALAMNQYVAAGVADGSIRQDATDCNTAFTSLVACSLTANFDPFDGTTLDVCADTGGNIVFTDLSTNGPTSWNWTFVANGGLTVSSTSSTMQNPTISVTGGTTGTIDVTLQVCDANGTCEMLTQTINVNVVTGAACPNDCNATSTDTGGAAGDYSSGENETWTFCPLDPACEVIQIEFTFVDIETSTGGGAQDGCWDFITIYDGNSNGSAVLAQTLCGELDGDGGTPSVGTSLLSAGDIFTATGATGCLTIVFQSDGSVIGAGWEADLSCVDNGQCACASAADCDDNNPCTTDACNATVCENTPIAGCCTTDADCDDNDPCTIDVCNANTCSNTPDPTACCFSDPDCDDSNPCTTDTCNGDGSCSNTTITGCCSTDADCDDSDPCTTDVCTANVCTNTVDPTCSNCPTFNGATADATQVCGDATTQVCIDLDIVGAGGGGTPITTYTEELDAGDPTFTRPFSDPCILSGVGTAVYYDVLPFTVDVTGNYTFAMTSFGGDGHGAIYCGTFDALDPCATYVASDDDGNGNSDPLIDPITLTAGIDYFLVTTTFSNGETGVFDWAISGAGNVLSGGGGGANNIDVTWTAPTNATLVSGGGATDVQACYTFTTSELCTSEAATIEYTIVCTDDGSTLGSGSESVDVYPLPPADLSTLVTVSGENTCNEPNIVVIAGCQNTVTVTADAGNPSFPVAQGNTGTAIYEVEFAHVGGPNCCTASGGNQDIILDGGFESGGPGSGWTEFSTEPFDVIDPTFPITGAFDAWLGGIAAGQTYVEQLVTIPATATAADLSFNVAAGQCDCAGGDSFDVTIGGVIVWSLCNPVAGQVEDATTICGGLTDPGAGIFVTVNIDVSPFADGNTYNLQFATDEVVNDGTNTSVFVDDVQLLIAQTATNTCLLQLNAAYDCPACNLMANVTNTSPTYGGIGAFYYEAAEIEIVNGTLPYNYFWDTDGSVRHAILSGGDGINVLYDNNAYWSVTITDANGCTAVATNDPSQGPNGGAGGVLNIVDNTLTIDNCLASVNDGAINIMVEGGSGTYAYDWSGPLTWDGTGQGTNTVGNAAQGWYSVTVSDTGTGEISYGWYWLPCGQPGRGKLSTDINSNITAMPNPFTEFTTFEFMSNESGKSTVELFDLAGAKIALLFNDYTEAGTTYKVGFTANSLPAGIYLTRFITPTGEIIHQKLMLTK